MVTCLVQPAEFHQLTYFQKRKQNNGSHQFRILDHRLKSACLIILDHLIIINTLIHTICNFSLFKFEIIFPFTEGLLCFLIVYLWVNHEITVYFICLLASITSSSCGKNQFSLYSLSIFVRISTRRLS